PAGTLVPVPSRQTRATGESTADEPVRPTTTPETLAKLPPVFKKDGSVTAGNASGINDGAAFMLVSSRDAADRFGLSAAGRLVAYAVAGGDPAYMGIGMVPATRKALQRAWPSLGHTHRLHANQAF